MRIWLLRRRHLTIAALVLTFLLSLRIMVLLFFAGEAPAADVFCISPCLPEVIIDAGHGGLDGGAVSPSGLVEAPLNLDISLRLRDLFSFIGVRSILTRTDESSLGYSEEQTTRENKRADLQARLQVAENNPNCAFLSIHLNKYVQEKYRGAQIFYSPNHTASLQLAACLQEKMRLCLDPGNDRRAKLSPDTVFLMKTIRAPAVTIECGFLSNPEETALLNTPAYRLKIAASICCGYVDYMEMRTV